MPVDSQYMSIKEKTLSHPPCFVLSSGIPRAQGCSPTSVPKAAHETWLLAILQWLPAWGSLFPGSAGGNSPGHACTLQPQSCTISHSPDILPLSQLQHQARIQKEYLSKSRCTPGPLVALVEPSPVF